MSFCSINIRRASVTVLLAVLAAAALHPQQPAAPSSPESHFRRSPFPIPLPRPRIHPPTGEMPKPGQSVVFDATALGAPIALDRNWRVGIMSGTDPAQPGFDDSAWPIRDAKDALAEVNEPETGSDEDKTDTSTPGASAADKAVGKTANGATGSTTAGPQSATGSFDAAHPHHGRPFAWFRIHIKLPQNHAPLALLVRLPVTHSAHIAVGTQSFWMDVYANGQRITPEGPNAAHREEFEKISRIYPIDIPASQTDLVIAVRIPYFSFGIDSYTAFFATRTFMLGEHADLDEHLSLWEHAMLFERLPTFVNNGLNFFLAVFLLALYAAQRDRYEYLWLGLHLLVFAPMSYIEMLGSRAMVPTDLYAAWFFGFYLLGTYFYFEFLIAFLSLRRRWYITVLRYSAPVLLTASPLLAYVHSARWVGVALAISILLIALWGLGWLIFLVLALSIAALKRNYEAALLLLPLMLSVVGVVELASTAAASSWSTSPVRSPLTFEAGPIPVHFSSVADLAAVVAILIIIFVRFLRINRERERASGELEAARSVQELMIPRESPQTPGFQVESVYTPANEVGGDFFHVESSAEGGLLVVIGDVAGKGLQAAMNVSMVMGALRRTPLTDPARILSELNQVLVGNASLTTCEAVYFAPTGELAVASAGHPAPFLNSQEIQLPGGLPLGVVAGVEYEEVRLYLHPGDRILLISDGVIEARRPNGELFGFDRLHNLSNLSASDIADAARIFGQEDDITVVTVRRLDKLTPEAESALTQISARRGTGSLRPVGS